MTLAEAFATIAEVSKLSVDDVRDVIAATIMTDANRRELPRIARQMRGRTSGVVRINLHQGSITAVRYDLPSDVVERMRGRDESTLG